MKKAKEDGKNKESQDNTAKGKDEPILHMFGLSIVKEIDPKSKQVHLEIKSKTEGLPMAEALLLVEGWLAAEKEKLIGPVFHPKKDAV
ncbi:MAG: hypothetical protein ABIJ21_03350 [Nanoarchaeota archaeon]